MYLQQIVNKRNECVYEAERKKQYKFSVRE